MQGKKEFCGILLCVNIFVYGFLALFKGINLPPFLSFEFAFFSSVLIVFLSFLHYQKGIIKKAQSVEIHTKPLNIFLKKQKHAKILNFKAINDDFKPTFKLALKNFSLFLSLAKFGAYAFLALGFLWLNKRNWLDIPAFLAGISALLLAIFIFMIWIRYGKFDTNH